MDIQYQRVDEYNDIDTDTDMDMDLPNQRSFGDNLGLLFMVIISIAIIGAIISVTWNGVVPSVFGYRTINTIQAVCLMAVVGILTSNPSSHVVRSRIGLQNKSKIIRIVVSLLIFAIYGFVLQYTWNSSVSDIFFMKRLNITEAYSLYILSSLLVPQHF